MQSEAVCPISPAFPIHPPPPPPAASGRACSGPPAAPPPSRHKSPPILQLRLKLVVGSTTKLDVARTVRPVSPIGNAVMKLELPSRFAAPAPTIHKSASPLISSKHLPPNLRRNRPSPPATLLPPRPRFVRKRRSLLLRFGEQYVQSPLDNGRRITIRDLMAQQVLQLCKRVPRLLTDRHLQLVSPRRKRSR